MGVGWGKFQNDAKTPERSAEINKGAWNTARKGIRIVETTWEGGRNGELWEIIKPILEKAERRGQDLLLPVARRSHMREHHRRGDARCGGVFPQHRGQTGQSSLVPSKEVVGRDQDHAAPAHETEFRSTLDEALSSPGLHPRFSIEGAGLDGEANARHATAARASQI